VIVVDDCSMDGTSEILHRLASEDSRITLIRHEHNKGKGAAVRTAIALATGDITIIHDADLEYNPEDIPALLAPFAKEGADAVFGSRYLPNSYRRALKHRHTMMNRSLTFICNWFTNLHLTDLETGYKAINTILLKSIPLRSNDFRLEVEIAFKLAKRRAVVFEAPIRYAPRSYQEGKKIGATDGLRALGAIFHFWIVDDLYKEDEYGSIILVDLEHTRRFSVWLGDTLRPYLGSRVLEIGAVIATLTNQLIPRDLYVASDINPNYLHYLRSYSVSKPYFRVMRIPLLRGREFSPSDDAGSAKVVIVNQTFVKRFLAKSEPIGTFVRTYSSSTSVADSGEIVGVVGDVIDRVGQNEDVPQVYAPFLQRPMRSMMVLIRAGGDPAALAPAVRASVWAIDKDQPVGTISTMKQVLDHKGSGDRLLGWLGGAFTALALGLAALGIYGMVSFMVAQRTQEIGLRMALGAQKGSVFRLVVGNGLLLATIGTALGLLLALPISRTLGSAHPDSWVRSLLVLAMAPALVIVATLLACYLPARRATRVDPMMALRCE